MALSRSIYAERFRDSADFAFGDQSLFQNRGQWRRFFAKRIGSSFDGRVILEVGCFDARYLGRIAAQYPHTAFVGLDWKCKPLCDGAQCISALHLRNVALLRGRAQDVLKIFAELEIDQIWVFHPDPCDRDVELKNRLIREPFMIDVHRVLRDAASSLTIKTDHPGYYQWVLGLLGLPEPQWFQRAYDQTPGSPSAPPAPRLRLRDLMPREQVPPPSEAVRSRFEVTMNSTDYWNDPATLAHCAGQCFSNEVTLFESRFLKKRQPIYSCEMRKK